MFIRVKSAQGGECRCAEEVLNFWKFKFYPDLRFGLCLAHCESWSATLKLWNFLPIVLRTDCENPHLIKDDILPIGPLVGT